MLVYYIDISFSCLFYSHHLFCIESRWMKLDQNLFKVQECLEHRSKYGKRRDKACSLGDQWRSHMQNITHELY